MAENTNTVIGKECSITGKLEVNGPLRVDGNVKGEVVSKETVVVGATGKVEGDIKSKTAVISGQVLGNVYAEDKVELQAKSLLEGDLKTKGLVIEHGAIFQGACRMKADDSVPLPQPEKQKV
jgi:cytoskeletal protein CcmA (bactofilin family)